MSWAEIRKTNNNIKRSFNELLADAMYNPVRIITTTGTYTPEKSGKYRVICIGAGANSSSEINSGTFYFGGGGAGGVAIKDIKLSSSTAYNVTVSTTASFGNILTATGGTEYDYSSTSTYPVGGTATGGDYNYIGGQGKYSNSIHSTTDCVNGGSVGVDIGEFSRQYTFVSSEGRERQHGKSILRYGGGGSYSLISDNGRQYRDTGHPAAILIIPLEMEE